MNNPANFQTWNVIWKTGDFACKKANEIFWPAISASGSVFVIRNETGHWKVITQIEK